MKGISIYLTSIVFAVMLSFSFLFLTAGTVSAQERFGCEVKAVLSAPGAGGQLFTFTGENSNGGDGFIFQISDGEDTGGELDEGSAVTISYVPTPGWALGGVECEGDGGLIVTNFDGGFSLDCENAKLGSTSCVINLVMGRIDSVPALSEWGMIAAATGLALIGVFFAVRRRRALV